MSSIKTILLEKMECPGFMPEQTYPADCTAAAQTILTLAGLGITEMAEQLLSG